MTYSQLFGWCNPALVMTRRTTTHPKCMGLWVIYITAGRAVLVHSSHGEWQRDDKRTILSLLCCGVDCHSPRFGCGSLSDLTDTQTSATGSPKKHSSGKAHWRLLFLESRVDHPGFSPILAAF
jgi:hypothetical protein